MKALFFSVCTCLATIAYAQKPRPIEKEVDIHLSEVEFIYPEYLMAIDSLIVDIQHDKNASFYKYIAVDCLEAFGKNSYMEVTAINRFPFSEKKRFIGYIPYKDFIILVGESAKTLTRINLYGRQKTFKAISHLPPFMFINMSWHVIVHKGEVKRRILFGG